MLARSSAGVDGLALEVVVEQPESASMAPAVATRKRRFFIGILSRDIWRGARITVSSGSAPIDPDSIGTAVANLVARARVQHWT
jgi:hypothetical protein